MKCCFCDKTATLKCKFCYIVFCEEHAVLHWNHDETIKLVPKQNEEMEVPK